MRKQLLRISRFLCLCYCALVAMAGYAAEADPTVELQKELRIDFSSYGKGMAEALRSFGNRPGTTEVTEHVQRTEQMGSSYKIKWITKKSEPHAPFPDYMSVNKKGTLLPGNMVLGKTSRIELIERMGKPNKEQGEKLTYNIPGYQGDDIAVFTFRQGKLVAVEWQWFVD